MGGKSTQSKNTYVFKPKENFKNKAYYVAFVHQLTVMERIVATEAGRPALPIDSLLNT